MSEPSLFLCWSNGGQLFIQEGGLDQKPNKGYSTYLHIDKAILSLHNLWELV